MWYLGLNFATVWRHLPHLPPRLVKNRLMFKRYRNNGFTLLEVILVVTVLAVLASAAIFGINAQDKLASAEILALKQILTVQLPKEVQRHYVVNDRAAWLQRLARIQVEMEHWPGINVAANKSATIYDHNGLLLQFETQHTHRINTQLRDALRRSVVVVSVNSDADNQRFKIYYKLN